MSFNVHEERTKLIQIINDDAFNFSKFNCENNRSQFSKSINFLWLVLILTIKYPVVELYLKNLLNNFTINELENVYNGWTILSYMCVTPSKISLNSFEMIINYGVNINKDYHGNNTTHVLLYNQCDNQVSNILNLFIKHGANLNTKNFHYRTVLDILIENQKKLNEETKNCIMTIIDFGGTTDALKNSAMNHAIYDFIEYYKYSTIKPAIKNENKI